MAKRRHSFQTLLSYDMIRTFQLLSRQKTNRNCSTAVPSGPISPSRRSSSASSSQTYENVVRYQTFPTAPTTCHSYASSAQSPSLPSSDSSPAGVVADRRPRPLAEARNACALPSTGPSVPRPIAFSGARSSSRVPVKPGAPKTTFQTVYSPPGTARYRCSTNCWS